MTDRKISPELAELNAELDGARRALTDIAEQRVKIRAKIAREQDNLRALDLDYDTTLDTVNKLTGDIIDRVGLEAAQG